MIEPTLLMLAFLISAILLAGPQAYRNWRKAQAKELMIFGSGSLTQNRFDGNF
jgi:hypothetical protein